MLFISFEGLDGSGKTTIAKMLKEHLLDQGYDVVLTREPGGNEIAEKIRDLILCNENGEMDGWTEALLYIASRRQHLSKTILPALRAGKIVICDRFMDSTSAYQGLARGLGIRTLDQVQSIVLGVTKPDLTIFFDIEPEEAKKRLDNRISNHTKKHDRMELEDKDFHQKVYEGYQILVSDYPERIKVVDARKSIIDVFEQVIYYVEQKLYDLENKTNEK